MKKLVEQHPAAALLLTCYAAGLLVFLAMHLVGFVQNRLAYRSGALAPAQLTLADFELHDLEEQEDGTLLSVGGDPQLLLRDRERRVENVRMRLSFSLPPLTVTAYWAAPGQDYSTRAMAYSQNPAGESRLLTMRYSGSQAFTLPAAGGQSLRLDPGTKVGNRITVHSITINDKRPFIGFFRPSAGEAVLLIAAPGLAGCLLWLALGALDARKPGKAGDARD